MTTNRTGPGAESELDPRHAKVLREIVRQHIQTGEADRVGHRFANGQAGAVTGLDPQRHVRTRGTRPAHPAAHLGRPGPDRAGLSGLRRSIDPKAAHGRRTGPGDRTGARGQRRRGRSAARRGVAPALPVLEPGRPRPRAGARADHRRAPRVRPTRSQPRGGDPRRRSGVVHNRILKVADPPEPAPSWSASAATCPTSSAAGPCRDARRAGPAPAGGACDLRPDDRARSLELGRQGARGRGVRTPSCSSRAPRTCWICRNSPTWTCARPCFGARGQADADRPARPGARRSRASRSSIGEENALSDLARCSLVASTYGRRSG